MSISGKESVTLLPQEITPSEWEDDERMGFLLSGFKDRSVNPKSYDAKMKFWKTLIEDYCLHCKQLVFDEAQLKKIFRRENKLPSCLAIVVDSMLKYGF
jgi:charged multivesicular body protein 7